MMVLSVKPIIEILILFSSVVIIFLIIIIRGMLFARNKVLRCIKCKQPQNVWLLMPIKDPNHKVKGKCIHCKENQWFSIENKNDSDR